MRNKRITVHNRLNQYRVNYKCKDGSFLSQAKLAKLMGISVNGYCRLERGGGAPTELHALWLARFFNVKKSDLFYI
jgi:DNA-binding XRE family transcriptional regulator